LNIFLRLKRTGHIAVVGDGNALNAARQRQINDLFGRGQAVK